MPRPNTEYEICLSGKIKISDLEKIEPLNKTRRKIVNYHSKYFDSEDLYLLNNSLGLRLRYENSCWVQTLKYERHDQSRLEWNSRSTSKDNRKIPKINGLKLPNNKTLNKNGCNLQKDLQDIAPTLEEKFSVHVKRTLWLLNYKGNKIEVSYDSGLIKTSEKQEKISEVELELIKGEPKALWLLAKDFIKKLPNLCVESQSKAFRGFLLNGLNWKNFNPSGNSRTIQKSTNFKKILKETVLEKNKMLSFSILMLVKKKEIHAKNILIQTLIELKYIFQFLVLIKVYKSEQNLSYFKSLRCKCFTLEYKLQIKNNKKFDDVISSKTTQLLIADIGLFANNIDTLLLETGINKTIEKFFLKIEESIRKRKNLNYETQNYQYRKRAFKLIPCNRNFFLSIGISEALIMENNNLDLLITN